MERPIRFKLNGRPVSLQTDDGRSLLWVLRDDLALTGTKYGCGEGICGACAVVVDGHAQRACRISLAEVEAKAVLTVEGLAEGGVLHPLQQAFIDHGAFQCGFCTPGMLMDAYALLAADPRPSRQTIIAGMDHNLCRCGAHQRIVDAIQQAAEQMAALP